MLQVELLGGVDEVKNFLESPKLKALGVFGICADASIVVGAASVEAFAIDGAVCADEPGLFSGCTGFALKTYLTQTYSKYIVRYITGNRIVSRIPILRVMANVVVFCGGTKL